MTVQYECIESKRDGGWVVEAIDSDNEGAVSRVLFMGANDEELAKEYAWWKRQTQTDPTWGGFFQYLDKKLRKEPKL